MFRRVLKATNNRWASQCALVVCTIVLVCVPVVALLGSSDAVAASSDDVAISVELGAANALVRGPIDPIVVTLNSRVLVRGVLRISDPIAPGVASEVPLEIPPRSPIRVVVPMAALNDPGVSVSFIEEGSKKVLASTNVFSPATPGEYVGVLPGARSDPFLRSADVGGVVALKIVAVDADDLERFPVLLTSLTIVAMREREFRAFTPGMQNAIVRWAHDGGEVLIDDEPGPSPESLIGRPVETSSQSAHNLVVGDGGFRFTGGLIRAGKWNEVAGFTVNGSYTDLSRVGGFQPFDNLGNQRRAVPRMGKLLVALGAYILAIGPVLFLVLRKRRKLVAVWTIVPIIATLTSVVVVGYGLSQRKSEPDVGMSVVDIHEGGAIVSATALLSSVSGSTRRFELKPGWHVADSGASNFSTGGSVTERVGTVDRVEVRIPAGGLQYVTASGPLLAPLSVDARATNDDNGAGIKVTVTNPNTTPLKDIRVFSGTGSQTLGELGPGQQGTVIVGVDAAANRGFGRHRPQSVQDLNDNQPDWSHYAIWNGLEKPPIPWGTVEVVGWVSAQESPLTNNVAGWQAVTRRLAVSPRVGGERATTEIRRLIVRNDSEFLARFDIDFDTDSLVYNGGPAQVWNGSSWGPISDGPLKLPNQTGTVLLRSTELSWAPTLRTSGGGVHTNDVSRPPDMQISDSEIGFVQPPVITVGPPPALPQTVPPATVPNLPPPPPPLPRTPPTPTPTTTFAPDGPTPTSPAL